MPDIPFWLRIAALAVLMAVAAGVDLWYRRGRATRWKEYLFILLAGCVAAVFGSLIDLMTSSISPEYFIYGKMLPADGIRWHAMGLGLKAGFAAGAIAGALCLFVGVRKRDCANVSLPQIAMLSWRPFLLAGVFAAVVPFACGRFDPMGFADQLSGTKLGPDGAARFLTVWYIHVGVYFGLAAGVVWMIAAIRRHSAQGRRAADAPALSP